MKKNQKNDWLVVFIALHVQRFGCANNTFFMHIIRYFFFEYLVNFFYILLK